MFTELFSNVWLTFLTVTGGLAEGIKTSFESLIYQTGFEESSSGGLDILLYKSQISPLASFLFAVGGFGLAIGIVYGIFRLIRGVASR